jgi:ferrochelatase
VPISFVSDHVETLGEIDHEARELAASLGIRQFELTPGLNDSPRFITALADVVLQAMGAKSATAEFAERSAEHPEAMLVD